MAKFVQFDVGTDEPTFYEVENYHFIKILG